MIAQAARIATLLLRHLSAYASLMRADLGDALEAWQKRLVATLALVLMVFAALVVASVCIVLVTWTTPYWGAAVTGIGVLYALAIGIAVWQFSQARQMTPRLLEHASVEWTHDRVLLEEALRRLSGEQPI